MKKIILSLALVILCLTSCNMSTENAASTNNATNGVANTQKTYNRAETRSGIPVERVRPKKIYKVEGGGDLYNIIVVEINGKEICYFDGYKAGGPVYIGD